MTKIATWNVNSLNVRLEHVIDWVKIHNPDILIFDEPTSNLDTKGKDSVYKIINSESKNKLVILASNEESDLSLCSSTIHVEEFKNIAAGVK